jgi:hypothetical protein
VVFLAIGFLLLQECTFLVPYKHVLWKLHGTAIASFAGLLFINLFAVIYLATRKLFLKDTGKKLAHIEKQLRSGSSISEELSKRLSA